ncbi:tetratricopeptide repeat protein 31-like isoform X3 [Synchiropus splendidus]|uniref:tetratricopeptide repeat protein 31-like isoform X3 n=2 Tax=Synchiropus splendidus TaxID=270530 RepID=UPI00237E4ACA|nr:tetratricopeptide repeat protein 31-like isoform X3 [Synchiropus splendidus]
MPPKREQIKGTPDHFHSTGMSFLDYVHQLYQEERLSDFTQNPLGFFDWRTGLPRTLQNDYPQLWHHCAAPYRRRATAEEAAKNARELIEEEERQKEKAARNKNKKMRKNEKKRLAKENAAKDNASARLQPKEDEALNKQKTDDETASVGSDTSAESTLSRTHLDDEESKENKGASMMANAKQQEKSKAKLQHAEAPPSVAAGTKDEAKSSESTKATAKQDLLQVEKRLETEKTAPADLCLKQSTQLAASGNHLAAIGQYEMAIKCFTDAIKLNPLEFKLFGNRSLCLERLQRYETALADADVALSMEPKWIKGLFRKGKALCGLKRYYDATLVFQEVLNLDRSSAEARKELERAQTLHLMEMGFTPEQCAVALRSQPTLEEAVQSLFESSHPEDQSAEGDDDWIVHQPHRPKPRQLPEPDEPKDRKETPAKVEQVKNVSPRPKSTVKLDLPSVFVSSIAPSVTYATLFQLFSRVGSVYSIKMLLDSHSAFVMYKLKEECDNALQLDGTVLEGSPLSVQHCDKRSRINADFNSSTPGYKRECFFWRTTGCTRVGCTFRHVPEHKGIDKDKFDGRLGLSHT